MTTSQADRYHSARDWNRYARSHGLEGPMFSDEHLAGLAAARDDEAVTAFVDALNAPGYMYTRDGHRASPDYLHAYIRDEQSPTGVHLAASLDRRLAHRVDLRKVEPPVRPGEAGR